MRFLGLLLNTHNFKRADFTLSSGARGVLMKIDHRVVDGQYGWRDGKSAIYIRSYKVNLIPHQITQFLITTHEASP